jgi:transaldolase
MPENTLAAFADHGRVKGVLPPDGGDADTVLAEFASAGVDDTALAARLQREGTASFDTSWKDLLDRLAAKRTMLARRDRAIAGEP